MLLDHDFESINPSKTGIDSITIGGANFPGGLNLPTGTTATRTTAPGVGATRWNTTLSVLETWNGTTWFSHIPISAQPASTVLIAPLGGGLPTFRLQGLAEHSDVVLTSPSANQTLTFNGANWVNSTTVGANAAGNIGVSNSGGGTGWTLVSGSRYTADFVHNLGTQNVVITVFDNNDNSVVIPDKVVATDANTVTVVVVGNTKTLKVVVVANGQSIAAGGSTPSSIITAFQGVTVTAAATKLNFVGSTVVSDAGGGTTNVSIGARFTNYANSFDSPNNADWVVNAFAATITDPTYNAMNVRSFSNTVEQGVGFLATIPAGATTANFRLRGRAATAQAGATVVQYRIYWRAIPSNAALGAWVGPFDISNITIPANAFFQSFVQSATLAAAGLVAGTTYQFELTRRVTGVTGTNLPAAFLLAESVFEFA